MATKRVVVVERRGGAFMVLYVSRQKYGRYSAAQFDARDHSQKQVEQWVKKQPHLVLKGA